MARSSNERAIRVLLEIEGLAELAPGESDHRQAEPQQGQRCRLRNCSFQREIDVAEAVERRVYAGYPDQTARGARVRNIGKGGA